MSEELSNDDWQIVTEIWAEHTNENIISGFASSACQCEPCKVYRRETSKSISEYHERKKQRSEPRPEVDDGIPF